MAIFRECFAFEFGMVAINFTGGLVQAQTIRHSGLVSAESAEAMISKRRLIGLKISHVH